MRLDRLLSVWKRERLGLTMIIASLAVIIVTVGLLFTSQWRAEEADTREQGINLVRLLSRMSFDDVVAGAGQQGVLSVLEFNQQHTPFAYLLVVDKNGSPLAEISSSGVIAPITALSSTPTTWLSERSLNLVGDDRKVTEFNGPLFKNGSVAGHVRLAYFSPHLGIAFDQLPFFASMALPIFMLAPFFYFLIRRELKPLQKIDQQLDRLSQTEPNTLVEVTATGELGEFMARFNNFIKSANANIGRLESENSGLKTSSKLLSYKRIRVESVLQSLADAVIVIDEMGTANIANARLKNLVGIDHINAIGKKPAEWCEDKELLAFLTTCSSTDGRSFNTDKLEYSPAQYPDKKISVTPLPLFSPKDNSQVLGTLVVFRDITAEHLAKESSGAFVAHVAHELKAPLHIIGMYSETLLGKDGDNKEFRVEASNVIHDETERLAELIDHILNITQIETGSIQLNRQRVRLGEMLEDTFNACIRSGEAQNLDIQIDVPNDLSPVAIDKGLFKIAVNNLLTNAIKYSDPGGQIVLTATESDETIHISVRDKGIGIPEDEQARVFDKFYRAEAAKTGDRKGHGLGLALAREIVHLHHGTLDLHSKPGEGSEFIITFRKETELLQRVA